MKRILILITALVAMEGFAAPISNASNLFYTKMVAQDQFPGDHSSPYYAPKRISKYEGGVGFRHAQGHHGVDISGVGSLGSGVNMSGKKVSNYSYSLPRVNYLFYVTPALSSSLYLGGGCAWGGFKTSKVVPEEIRYVSDHMYFGVSSHREKESGDVFVPTITKQILPQYDLIHEYHGVLANLVLGYEFNRKGIVKTFLELDATVPTSLAMRDSYESPIVSASLGLGF